MKQITVITANQVGELADVTGVLAERGINVEDIEAEAIDRRGLIVLTVALADYDRAFRVLRDKGFQAITEDALTVRVEDRPGALAEIAQRFKDAGIGMRSLHIIQRREGWSMVSIVPEARGRDRAKELVADLLA